ncbi:TlyA family RNA methyltransferase [Bifidobacterium sp.]|jgi:23S rRNA (cytidine1920-2'-O)/16S rRNA (cytidine1409-2'-O)-methyltransferase|uniref:TlyA family RNA methyltransferase n=1 Tax=Bifidobacterium sp. TaxID=41200 RepID=UPI0025B80A7D|nr:TlyA family RNA methyltransferase [Bifidobacterium sp.]MCH4209220.1 TlyA family RNA methyltransferase [Bifidobacterium sp.]MCI1224669.1 TlyA family RNA methyltransferase [Bifidobacterium sp.]
MSTGSRFVLHPDGHHGATGSAGNAAAQPLRLDLALVARGLIRTRTKAQALIREGHVLVNGVMAHKASAPVGAGDALRVDKGEDYVSRGAYKLVGAFHAFASSGLPSPRGLHCLDIGASTGGFCDVLLRRGADKVIALDVGHGQLDARIAADPRIIEMSGVNIRDVLPDDLPVAPQLIVADVSFVSLTYVIPVIAQLAAPGAHVVLLVKPQFEVGKGRLGKNGVVEDPVLRERALHTVMDCARMQGFDIRSHCVSPIEGSAGNIEYLLYACLSRNAPSRLTT